VEKAHHPKRARRTIRLLLSRRYRSVLSPFARGRVLLAFDFDGTLAPLVARPRDAAMRPRTAMLLDAVTHRYPSIVVSGRSERDVRRRLKNAPVVAVIGNHGGEDSTDHAAIRATILAARRILTPIVRDWPSAWIENKTYSVAIHYRTGLETGADGVRAAVRAMPGVRIVPGKLTLNIVATSAPDKGVAVERLRRALGCTRVLFVGDDETDEHVFRHMPARRLIGVRVGTDRPSRARFALRSQEEVDDLLDALLKLRSQGVPIEAENTPVSLVLGETLEFMRLLWAVDHAMHKRSKRMGRELGVTGEQRMALRLAAHARKATAGELAMLLHVHPSTLTGMLKRLARQGLVATATDHRDRRRIFVTVTPKGMHAARAAKPTIESALSRALASSSPADIQGARAVLERMITTLK
jgi:trehalose 6-phosphate phosphatase